jgi:ankyrin repeat protein
LPAYKLWSRTDDYTTVPVTVELLIANGADVNAKGGDVGLTPLHCAVGNGHKEIAERLIAAGADVNAKDDLGWTPLHEAAHRESKEIAELLIANGADVNTMQEDGETPLDWADGELADFLRKHDGKTGEELKAEGK